MNILITGGTGSFGQAFTRKLLEYNTERICIFSRGEHAQAEMRESLGDPDNVRWFIGDVRDKDRLKRALYGVGTVVHAAALKRIEVGAYNPIEMVKTNVIGAMNLIEAAQDAFVDRVVALSTDKAYQPISPYGQSKALMEGLMLAANNVGGSEGTKFAVTRYGNVAGSKGSIIPKWRDLIAQGKPVPVTDPECTRFWMTMDEAINLVLRAIDLMPDEILIPSLPAFQIVDLAIAMEAEMTTIGLPTWEKKHEGLRDGLTSDVARRMRPDELKEALEHL